MVSAGGIPPELTARAQAWRAAEDGVYPLAVTDTDAYERAVSLVGLLRPHFESEAPSLAELPVAADRAGAVLRLLAARAGTTTVGVNVDAVVGCAAAARLRELLAAETPGSEEQAVLAARDAGLAWAVVAEPDLTLAGMGVPQQWIEVHVASGVRLVRGISMDLSTGAPRFTIEVTAPGESSPAMRLEFENRQQWLEESEQMRADFDEWGGRG